MNDASDYDGNNDSDHQNDANSDDPKDRKNPDNKQNGHCRSNAHNFHITHRGAGKSSPTGRSREEAILF